MAPAFALTLGRADRSVRVEEFTVKRKKEREMISPHSLMGSSDKSLQSFTLSHTLLMSIHSPFLQRNFLGPSHFVTENATKKKIWKMLFVIHVIYDMDASKFPQFSPSETMKWIRFFWYAAYTVYTCMPTLTFRETNKDQNSISHSQRYFEPPSR